MTKIYKYKKKNGKTFYKFNAYLGVDDKTGKQKRTTRQGFKTKKEAVYALKALESGLEEVQKESKLFTYEQIYKLWYPDYKLTVSEQTALGTERYFRLYILPKIGAFYIDKITYSDCEKAVLSWYESHSRYATIKAYASKVMRYAVRNGYLEHNLFDEIELPKKKRSTKKESEKFYTKKELLDFLKWAHENLCLMDCTAFYLLAITGLRKGELRALVWNDVDFNAGTLSVNKAIKAIGNTEKIGVTKNEASIRVVGLDETSLFLLSNLKEKSNSKSIFTNETSNGFMYRDHLRDMMKKYPNKKITIHGFRHTNATLMLDSGISVKDVQKNLGHSSADMTLNVYAHSLSNNQKIVHNFSSYLKE